MMILQARVPDGAGVTGQQEEWAPGAMPRAQGERHVGVWVMALCEKGTPGQCKSDLKKEFLLLAPERNQRPKRRSV